jgi:hypothetical protein
MADILIGQGISAAPRTGAQEILWNRIRRSQYTLRGFPAATTTPFSGNTPPGILVFDAATNYVGTPSSTPGAEFEMSELAGVQLIVSNNASGQVLSGVTLSDYDTLPSGVVVPGQSYLTATNLATGASATLSALNLASGSAVRLFVPINQGSLRQLYIEPTYAAAVTVGTGSLEVRTIPEYSSGFTQLTGRLAPLTAGVPVLFATIPYTAFTASTTYVTPIYYGVLHRNARSRSFILQNTLEEAISGFTYALVDSVLNPFYDWGSPSSPTYTTGDDIAIPGMEGTSNADSVYFRLPMGATVPVSGEVNIYVGEVF